jgi:FkbH-like protein
MIAKEQIKKANAEKQSIKCIVWDLDNTVWDGILLEDENVSLRNEVVAVLKEMDRRGILHSIASKNDHDTAVAKLEELGIAQYFLYPEINWNPKSSSLRAIAQSLNIGLDTFAFVDDNPFERDEVTYELPEVTCIDALDVSSMWDMESLQPRFITSESALRRKMYMSDIKRNNAEDDFTGNNEAFLAELDMVFRIKRAEEEDLQRAEELTVRTNQLNTTGYTYSYDELNAFRQSPNHLLLVSSLNDRYGTYGTIGLALVEMTDSHWMVKLLLMSCRVMSRGVGTIMMNYIMKRAKQFGVTLRAEFLPNGRNRMMYVTYKFGGFKEIEKHGELIVFENDLSEIQPIPGYVKVELPSA